MADMRLPAGTLRTIRYLVSWIYFYLVFGLEGDCRRGGLGVFRTKFYRLYSPDRPYR